MIGVAQFAAVVVAGAVAVCALMFMWIALLDARDRTIDLVVAFARGLLSSDSRVARRG